MPEDNDPVGQVVRGERYVNLISKDNTDPILTHLSTESSGNLHPVVHSYAKLPPGMYVTDLSSELNV